MSVINQMLKDLQQRQGDQSIENGAVAMPVVIKTTPYKSVLMVIITIVVTLAVVYTFNLYSENQQLKLKSQQLLVDEPAPIASKTNNIAAALLTKKEIVADDKAEHSPVEPQVENNQLSSRAPLQASITHTVINKVEQQESIINNQAVSKGNKVYGNEVSGNRTKTENLENKARLISKETSKETTSMVISRTQLSPEMLAKQKMNRAKEAVANNNITKAEQLFEDVLLVLPSQKDARKQLAALWFGRQSYQAALNLLAQGISLDSSDQDLRMLAAQIYIKQGQSFQAFKVLQSHPNVQTIIQINYQSMLATQAQASQQFSFAISAYKRLAKLQANIGRWWLGLAIAYDSSSQFELASQTYTLALNKNDLSDSARKFITQRLQELGE
ncbi:MAG: tetratricopeptide repeat protein [Colwellia sp.]|nr:tetratricopeptide repeat protein [Colwellia sp.]